jgi:hypothetical protein
VNLDQRKKTDRRTLSGNSLRTLGLVERNSPPQRKIEQYVSEQSLFDESNSEFSIMSSGRGQPIFQAGNTPFAVGPSDNQGTVPGVPGVQQPDSRNARLVEPQQIHQSFDNPFRDATADQIHSLIQTYMQQFDAKGFIDNIKYQGFNRDEFIRSSIARISASQMLRLALMGAIRGANFDKISRSSAAIDGDLSRLASSGTIKRTARRADDITILRCTSAIPQWAAYYMSQVGVVKKLPGIQCPAFLQFPAAASLPMSGQLRHAHVQFSIQFSKVIGGIFNENIYMAMFNNQLSMSEIPDQIRMHLGINSEEESRNVDVANMLAEEVRRAGR